MKLTREQMEALKSIAKWLERETIVNEQLGNQIGANFSLGALHGLRATIRLLCGEDAVDEIVRACVIAARANQADSN